jgi:hypothetical protein
MALVLVIRRETFSCRRARVHILLVRVFSVVVLREGLRERVSSCQSIGGSSSLGVVL